ncbi:MAG: T9SS type A sorting domain-containing protein [Bacteroidota bacterium]
MYLEKPDSINPFLDIELPHPAFQLHMADMNGDGYDEVLITSNSGFNEFWYFENDGAGSLNLNNQFVEDFLSTIPTQYYTSHIGALNFSDIDSDGDIDLVSNKYNVDGTPWYTWIDEYHFEFKTNENGVLVFENFQDNNGLSFYTDLDNDGDIDKINLDPFLIPDDDGYYPYTETLAFSLADHIRQDNGDFISGSSLLQDNTFKGISFIDFDLDGDEDFLIREEGGSWNSKLLLEKDANLNVHPVDIDGTIFQLFNTVHQLDIGDLDNDGNADLIFINTSNNEIRWLEEIECVEGNPCNVFNDCTELGVLDNQCECIDTIILDTDGDGICDTQDLTNGDCILGDSCDDNDPCTYWDELDANCNCVGQFLDSDGDGICNLNDQCPGEDDTIDVNSNGIPDCMEITVDADFEEFDDGVIGPSDEPSDKQVALQKQVKIYPNPSSEFIYIQTALDIEYCVLFNSLGEEILIKQKEVNQIDMSPFSRGIYILEVHSEKGTVRKRISKN